MDGLLIIGIMVIIGLITLLMLLMFLKCRGNSIRTSNIVYPLEEKV
jgi:hypothetical protein